MPWELLGSQGKAQRGHGPHHSPLTPRTDMRQVQSCPPTLFGPAVEHAGLDIPCQVPAGSGSLKDLNWGLDLERLICHKVTMRWFQMWLRWV